MKVGIQAQGRTENLWFLPECFAFPSFHTYHDLPFCQLKKLALTNSTELCLLNLKTFRDQLVL